LQDWSLNCDFILSSFSKKQKDKLLRLLSAADLQVLVCTVADFEPRYREKIISLVPTPISAEQNEVYWILKPDEVDATWLKTLTPFSLGSKDEVLGRTHQHLLYQLRKKSLLGSTQEEDLFWEEIQKSPDAKELIRAILRVYLKASFKEEQELNQSLRRLESKEFQRAARPRRRGSRKKPFRKKRTDS
ncbi:MAG: hypothetical protein VX278_23395, partial [Myxococcota bacterium]|nr:hypothetical protein [Myxococcota bacterium]